MNTLNTDDANITTNTENNEVDDDATVTSKWHLDIKDLVDSQGRLLNQLPAYNCLLNAEFW